MAIKIRNFEYENMKMACFVLLVKSRRGGIVAKARLLAAQ